MPRVIITTEPVEGQQPAIIYQERVVAHELESDHYASQLLERVSWGISDAHDKEQHRYHAV